MRPLRRAILAAALLAPLPAFAQMEHEVKAAYLFKFLTYVEWTQARPEDAQAPIVIGIVGSDDVHDALREIVRGRTAHGHPVEVRRLGEDEPPSGVHMLFVGRAAAAELPRLAAQTGLLVVSEIEGALDRGAMINLVRSGNRVRFEVAPETAERNGVRISSRMLSVAQYVKPGRP